MCGGNVDSPCKISATRRRRQHEPHFSQETSHLVTDELGHGITLGRHRRRYLVHVLALRRVIVAARRHTACVEPFPLRKWSKFAHCSDLMWPVGAIAAVYLKGRIHLRGCGVALPANLDV